MSKSLLAVCALLLLAAPALAQEAGPWELVWQDDFERAEVGPEWSAARGSMRIVDGQLELTGNGAHAMLPGSFPTDVRLEFDAAAVPDRAPCDISVFFAGNEWWGRGGYLLAFGGKSNTVNQLLGNDLRVVDDEPPFLIEHGRKYHCVAAKEGGRLTYEVDGTTILSADDPQPLGGPGFDRIGLVTWTGLLADGVKAYRRVPPAPDGPKPPPVLQRLPLATDAKGRLRVGAGVKEAGLEAAVAAHNGGDLAEAARLFREMPEGLVKAAGLAYTYGNLSCPEKTDEFEALADLFQTLAAADPDDQLLAGCVWASREFARLKVIRGSHDAALRLTESGPDNNPFYHKARMYLARYLWWDGAEGGDQRLKNVARGLFAELREVAPDQPVIREYLGEEVPWGEDLIAEPEAGVPEWAAYLREAYARQVRIIEWWFDNRQSPDGQLGGGWGDDVEILRTWSPIAAISTGSPKVVAGIEKMSEGIWRILTNGYVGGIGDVEHSAEPSADTMPAMLLLRYGDALWVERNLATARTIRDVLTGRDAKGYVRFKSAELGARAVGTHVRQGGDTAYHTRIMKHLIWLAWQGNTGARDLFLNWAEGWGAAITAEIGTKPAGVPPGTLWYPSGDISPAPDVAWWDPDYNYYGWPGPFGHTTDALLSAYRLSGGRKYLEPLLSMWTTTTSGPRRGYSEDEPGSEAWIIARLQHQGGRDQLAYYRWLTGDGAYDEYQRRFDFAATKYMRDGDLDAYLASFEGTAKGLRNSFAMRTSEVIMTDRAGMGGAKATFAAYTGAPRLWGDGGTPLIAVTWVVPDTDFAAVVTHATEQRLRVWLYNFHPDTTRMGMQVWRLQPGDYVVTQGGILDGEQPFQHRYAWGPAWPVTVAHRGDVVWVDVPAGVAYAVDVRLRQPRPRPETAPDLAIAARDITIEPADAKRSKVMVRVHNIGNEAAREFRVALEVRDDEAGWKQIDSKGLALLDAPTDLEAKTILVGLSAANTDLAKGWRVVVDSQAAVAELYEGNNIVEKDERSD